jgi:hypothetical protein
MPKKKPVLKTPLYGNYRVYDLDNQHIFNTGLKKVRWYLARNLAEIIQEDPLAIRLTFAVKGRGNSGDKYYLQERKNICVVCGTNANLTKHHIVPRMYRAHFDEELKNHTAFDVLPVCYTCHESYEVHATAFKKELLAELSIERNNNSGKVIDTERKKVCVAASALLRFNEAIPEERRNKLIGVVRAYYGQDEITNADLEEAATIKYNLARPDHTPEGQLVVEALNGDFESFIKRWRRHFLIHTEAKHMPEYWDVDRTIRR